MATEPGPLLERLVDAARETHDAKVDCDVKRERRDQLIVEATDLLISPERIAAAAGLSKTRVLKIVAGDDAD